MHASHQSCRSQELLKPWADAAILHMADMPLARYLDGVADASLDFIFLMAPQHGPQELALLPLLWAKLRPQGYIGGFWWSDCDDAATRRYCRAAAHRVVPDVRSRVLRFAESVGRNVMPTTASRRVRSWYFAK